MANGARRPIVSQPYGQLGCLAGQWVPVGDSGRAIVENNVTAELGGKFVNELMCV